MDIDELQRRLDAFDAFLEARIARKQRERAESQRTRIREILETEVKESEYVLAYFRHYRKGGGSDR